MSLHTCQSYSFQHLVSYSALRIKKHSPWLEDFDYGMMVLGQAALYETYWFNSEFLFADKAYFYKRRSAVQEQKIILEHVAFAFVILAVGLISSLVGVGYENLTKNNELTKRGT